MVGIKQAHHVLIKSEIKQAIPVKIKQEINLFHQAGR